MAFAMALSIAALAGPGVIRSAASGSGEVEDMANKLQSRRLALARSLAAKGIRDSAVLAAIEAVERHRFMPPALLSAAYEDRALPIGAGQTISQPYVVAFMTEALGAARGQKVLEIGTGSGYQAAVLAQLGVRVFSVEIVAELSRTAASALAAAGYHTVKLAVGDGYAGWPDEAPFDRVIVTAAAREIPPPLIEQLVPGGRLVMPVEDAASGEQWIVVLDKDATGATTRRKVLPVRFVPLTGRGRDGAGENAAD
jgi:protein-L-isoaspartate(D-aspartate) O-methyltransferase